MRILVTGAGGFLGSAFTRCALQRGHTVLGLLLPDEPPPAKLPADGAAVWLRGTLADAPWVELRCARPEVCVHFAWIATPGVYLEAPENEDFLRWSLDFIRRVCDLGVAHVVGVGTCIEYRMTGRPLLEDSTPVEPTTRYARCKNALREALAAQAARQGWQLGWGRVFYPYGVGEHPARLCSTIARQLARGEKLLLRTPDSTKDYIYVEDLAEAILLTVERRYAGVINWGTGVGVTVKHLADTLAGLLGRPDLIEVAPDRQPDPFNYVVADAGRLRNLGWQPRHSLVDGLRKLVQAVRPPG